MATSAGIIWLVPDDEPTPSRDITFGSFVRTRWSQPGVKARYLGTLLFGLIVVRNHGVVVFLVTAVVAIPLGLLLQWRHYRKTGG